MTLRMEAHKFADIFPMMDEIDFTNLKKDIKENGFDKERPIILYEKKILDGRNRFKACKELNVKPIFINYEGESPLSYVISNNLDRRHLTESQRAVIGVVALPLLEEEARKRQGTKISLPQKIGELKDKHSGEATQITANQFKTNREYLRMAKKIQETSPELFEELKQGTKDFSDVKKEQRMEKIQKQREEIKQLIPERKLKQEYDVIVIDPPWKYDGGEEAYNSDSNRGTTPYPTMSIEEIKNIKLPVGKDCILWLWTTNLFMRYAFEILDTWGFTQKTILTWDKQHIGTGRWLRSQTEHCILAVKGNPLFINTTYSTLISEMKTKQHSEKPEGFYNMLDDIHKDCAKLDYFARKERKGWDVYGDEV